MFVLVTYDVSTVSAEGRRRLRRVAKVCENFGQRVQYSVFECSVGERELVRLRHDLLEEMNPSEDSLRLYYLGQDDSRRIEHYGQKRTIDYDLPRGRLRFPLATTQEAD